MQIPNFEMKDRVALLTGAGRGIGLGMAQALAAAGCAVAIQDIDLEVAEQAARDINDQGGRAIALGGDIVDLSLPTRLVAETVSRLGGLHVLINNASIQKEISWMDSSIDDIEREVRADFISPILFCREAVPHMREQKLGRIINLGSIQGLRGNPNMLPYSMSKAALENMTTGLSRQLAGEGITVNLLAPGYFNTYRNRDQFQEPGDEEKRAKGTVPAGRIGHPEDCGGVALLLCSDAGSYITGQTIYIDGGLSVR